jgi:hypothetical protein
MKVLTLFICLLSSISMYGQTENENFNGFMFRFGSDPAFQLERIIFPLEYVTWEDSLEIGGEMVTHRVTKNKWDHDYLYMNESYRGQVYDNFDGELRNTDERLFQWIGVETGVNVKFYFRRIKGKWFLVKKESLGD